MKLDIVPFKPKIHHEIVSKWWLAHKWTPLPMSHLPENGFISCVDGELAAAGWLYKTDSAFCLFEWIVANPDVRRERRAAALDHLFEHAKTSAKSLGFQTIFMTAHSGPLIKRLVTNGFSANETDMTNLTFNIGGL